MFLKLTRPTIQQRLSTTCCCVVMEPAVLVEVAAAGKFMCDDCVRCRLCGSSKPEGDGSVVSPSMKVHWWFDYTMCDPCGRKFAARQHCPECDKVWADADAAKFQRSQSSVADANIGADDMDTEMHEVFEEPSVPELPDLPVEYHSPMIACDSCGRWVHNSCTHLPESELKV
jgi:hypothetical protein